jgi:SAM-dependent methyltransferase
MEATGERLIPGQFPALIENEHLARYYFAMQFVQGKEVADIACGSGYGTQLLAKSGAKNVHGIDLSEDAVNFGREYFSAENVKFSVASAEQLTALKNGEFDVVVSFETIEHLVNVEAYLDEIKRVLRPGGTFLVSTPDRRIGSVLHWLTGRPQNPYHVREYTERELVSVLSTRFQIKGRYCQELVPAWLVFWPIQACIKGYCRIIGTPSMRAFKERLYSNGGQTEVTLKSRRSKIPKFWVFLLAAR